jgi:hypothetical protein
MNSLASEDFNQDCLYDQMDLHTNKELITIKIPPGKLGITFSRIGENTIITRVHSDSQLKDILKKNDHLYELNNIELKHFSVNIITTLFYACDQNERIIKILRPI